MGVTLVPVYQFFKGGFKLGELVGPTPQELRDLLLETQRPGFVELLLDQGEQAEDDDDDDDDESMIEIRGPEESSSSYRPHWPTTASASGTFGFAFRFRALAPIHS